jgi:regulator of sirC expression with transglutaminase-like and TPR domain
MDTTEQIDKKFSQIASLPDQQVDLARGALLIAAAAYPDMDESLYLERLDRMASKVKGDMTADISSADIIIRINHLLFDEKKFRGNREKYYDPDNSFLNRVLDRKTGIPITLSLIYMEIAGRLGLDVRGIGLPGHFIVALYPVTKIIYIDPFNRGKILSVDDCLELVRTHMGETVASDHNWLRPIDRKELLARMLRNLKLIYAQQDNDIMLFKMIHWILTLQPDAPGELRERAILYEAIGNPTLAIKDWLRYITNIDDHESVTKILARIDYLKTQPSRIH